jgi:hypothetical protein
MKTERAFLLPLLLAAVAGGCNGGDGGGSTLPGSGGGRGGRGTGGDVGAGAGGDVGAGTSGTGGDVGTGGAGTLGTGGTGGTGGDPRLDSFVGTWDFSTGLISGSCSDGYTVNDTLNSADFVVIERGGSGLLLKYYCDTGWSMSLPAGATTASARAGETCNFQRTSSGVTTNLVWSVNALTFATGDGQAGTVVGRLSGPFSDSTPNTGTCNLMFSGDLLKQ